MANDNAAKIAKLQKRIKTGGMSMKRGNLKRTLEKRIAKLQAANESNRSTLTLQTPAQAYTAANKNKTPPKHRKNSKKSWLDRAWGR